jgi:hypothetical protein
MAGVVIVATVSKGDSDLMGDLDALLAANGMARVVMHHAGACDPCRANDDPDDVPCSSCRGNIAGRYPSSRNAEEVGNLCQCTVEIVEVDSEGHPVNDDA